MSINSLLTKEKKKLSIALKGNKSYQIFIQPSHTQERKRERETFNLISTLFNLQRASFTSTSFELNLLGLSGTLSCRGKTTPCK